MFLKKILFIIIFTFCVLVNAFAYNERHGIYITQDTMKNPSYISYLIKRGQEVGINTFVIDYERYAPYYKKSLALVKQSGIRYVARIVIYPDGANDSNVLSVAYWGKKYKLVDEAISLGADEIQLDYIRYNSAQPKSPQNSLNIKQVVKWFKSKVDEHDLPMEIDVFGISTFGESPYIGQNLRMLSTSVDAMCPMVYPSHYEPYLKYAKMPYFAIRSSMEALRRQFFGVIPFKVYPFIEVYNYRYSMSQQEKLKYIAAEIEAVQDSKVDGFYVWNIHNNYDNLFTVMKSMGY